MSQPQRIVPLSERSANGALKSITVQAIRSILLKRGVVLLPSDSGYSVGLLAADGTAASFLGRFLQDFGGGQCLAFESYYQLSEHSNHTTESHEIWVNLSFPGLSVIEQFTPGPLVMLCDAVSELSQKFAWPNETYKVGVRISDSVAERQIAGSTLYPLALRPLFDNALANRMPIVDFKRAVSIVSECSARLGGIGWVAVEGRRSDFVGRPDTIVDASGSSLGLIEEGAISYAAIENAARQLPALSFEDWA